jgi:phosphoribosylformylglycinamidine cyclo-ligase
MSYRDAGVDIDAQDEGLRRIKSMLASTRTPGVLSDLGAFGGLFALPASEYEEPVLVASTDGVGTKLKVAVLAGIHDTVGADLVNHCVNDIVVQGARPLFFLDYFGASRLDPSLLEAVVSGVARACRENRCALIGGETAELPDLYPPGEYDLVGTIVGVVERSRVIDGRGIREGDLVLGLPSTGLHTNGYSLARKIVFEHLGLGPHDPLPGHQGSVAKVLLAPHRSYWPALRGPLEAGQIRGLAHITGGGLTDNLPRIMPEGLSPEIERGTWPVPPVFPLLQEQGRIDLEEMYRVFNMGVGMAVVVAPDQADAVEQALDRLGEAHDRIGRVVPGNRRTRYVDGVQGHREGQEAQEKP